MDMLSLLAEHPEIESRFWQKVKRLGPDDCWDWTGYKDARDGRGRINSSHWKNVPMLASHMALYVAGKARPSGLFALHSCDNGWCVNPAHLRWGTQKENVADMLTRKGEHYRAVLSRVMSKRAARGMDHVNARLTDEQCRAIISDPRLNRVIAAEYGVSRGYVGELKAGHKRRSLHV